MALAYRFVEIGPDMHVRKLFWTLGPRCPPFYCCAVPRAPRAVGHGRSSSSEGGPLTGSCKAQEARGSLSGAQQQNGQTLARPSVSIINSHWWQMRAQRSAPSAW